MRQTVYVLGAGASYGDSLKMSDEQTWKQRCRIDVNTEADPATATNPPVITGFFNEKFLWWTYPERIEKLYPEMINYIRRRWSIKGAFGTGDWLSVNLEDVFTSAAIDLEFNPPGTNAHAQSQLLLNHIKRHISFVLGRCTICRYGEYTRALVNGLDETDTIINFNYDLLVDQELITSSDGRYFPRNGFYQYHNFADVILDKPFNDYAYSETLRGKNTGSGLYLKMHGSLNWTTCTNPSCARSKTIKIEDVFSSLVLRNSPTGGPPRCNTCQGEVSTVIIPPLLNKPILNQPVIRNIWSNALHALRQAQRIVIIGYSFPATDFYTEWLFRSARIDEDTIVQVINPLNNPKHKDKQERTRFLKKNAIYFSTWL